MNKRFFANEMGSVSVIGAVLIAIILLVIALAIDLSILYVAQQRSQVVADVANLAATNTTEAIAGGTATAAAIATTNNMAQINGFGSAMVQTDAVDSPKGDGSLVLHTAITQDTELGLGLLSSAKNVAVKAASWASLTTTGECLTSLHTDITILNNATVSGPNCAVRAYSDLYLCWNSFLSVDKIGVGYSKSWETPFICTPSAVSPTLGSFTFSDNVTDAYENDSRIVALRNKLFSMVSGWPYGALPPVNPTVPIVLTSKTYSGTTGTLAQTNYGTVATTSSNLTFSGNGVSDANCSSPTTLYGDFTLSGSNKLIFKSGCYVFQGAVKIAAGASATFDIASGANVVFVFKAGLNTASNATVSFGEATFYFNYTTIANGSGSSMIFNDGTYYLWGGSLNNSSSTSTMTFGAGSVYGYMQAATNNGTLTFGKGTRYFDAETFYLNSGSTTAFGVGDTYFYGGAINAYGKALTFGSGGSTDSGGGTFYMLSGTMTLGATTLNGIGTTFALYLSTPTVQDTTLNIIAPMAKKPSYGFRDILFYNPSGGLKIYQFNGQANVMSGLIYGPLGFFDIGGNSTTSIPTNGCLQLVGGAIGINSGATVALAPCHDFTATMKSAGELVQ